MRVDVRELRPLEGNELLAELDVHLDAPLGGLPLDGPLFEIVSVERGKLSRIRLFLDRAEALAAVGLDV
jgi:hypothetical protein